MLTSITITTEKNRCTIQLEFHMMMSETQLFSEQLKILKEGRMVHSVKFLCTPHVLRIIKYFFYEKLKKKKKIKKKL